MLLIADSGSTKTSWVLTDGKKSRSGYNTIGYNPLFMNTEEIYQSLSESLIPKLNNAAVKKIFFYGADCSTPSNITIVQKALSRCFSKATIYIEHDMLAAARALLGNSPGFAAIIGTGSNTCIYDGNKIEQNISPLGYLLGDEGSGSYIGKRILRDLMRGYMPYQLEKKFNHTYHLSPAEIFDFMYNQPSPNRFLASFCKFADTNKSHPYIKKVVMESFSDLFENLVNHYPGYENYSFNCVGSVGSIFKDLLKEVVLSRKMKMGKVIASPIEDLVRYHMKNND